MSYPVKYRKRVLEYREEGHTLEETSKVFKAAISTIRKWEKQMRETGDLTPKVPERSFKKIDPSKLRAYVARRPDACQKEIAMDFGCSKSAVQKALKRLGITRKKRPRTTRNRTMTKSRHTNTK